MQPRTKAQLSFGVLVGGFASALALYMLWGRSTLDRGGSPEQRSNEVANRDYETWHKELRSGTRTEIHQSRRTKKNNVVKKVVNKFETLGPVDTTSVQLLIQRCDKQIRQMTIEADSFTFKDAEGRPASEAIAEYREFMYHVFDVERFRVVRELLESGDYYTYKGKFSGSLFPEPEFTWCMIGAGRLKRNSDVASVFVPIRLEKYPQLQDLYRNIVHLGRTETEEFSREFNQRSSSERQAILKRHKDALATIKKLSKGPRGPSRTRRLREVQKDLLPRGVRVIPGSLIASTKKK